MSEISVPQDTRPSSRPVVRFLQGRRGQQIREAVTAYLFLLPALIIIGLFGLFPLAFSVYESLLKGLNTFLGKYGGLDNYTKAIGELAYVLAFWIAAVLVFLAVRSLLKVVRTAKDNEEQPWVWGVPGLITAGGLMLLARFLFLLLPEVLDIANKVRGQQATTELFNQLLGEAWRMPEVVDARRLSILVFLGGLALAFVTGRFVYRSVRNNSYWSSFTLISLFLMMSVVLAWFTVSEITRVYAAALENGTGLNTWSQVVTISAGFILLLLAYWLWSRPGKSDSTVKLVTRLAAVGMLIVAGWVLVGELPQVVAAGDKDWWDGLLQTVYYSVGTIPFQLGISLGIAVLLFQDIRGQGLFRLIYFLPYITPTVASAAVFRIFFSGRATAPVNSVLAALGMQPQLWIDQPTGIFEVIGQALGFNVPGWAAGPSMALGVIIIFNIWTYVGFDIVIFLAGLGSIPSELYEAAAIDGAGRWAQFRHLTLPLLSPTIYFLTLWATIGTFKAFNHIWVLRSGAALGTSDTASVVIFNEFKRNTRYGYASALAVVLLLIILVLTLVNNQVANKRVFYG